MTLSPRAKLLLIAAGFALPIAASFTTYSLTRPEATGNYGELLLPPAKVSDPRLKAIAGRWALVAYDAGDCTNECADKLMTMRQVHLALGRGADRIVRVLVAGDGTRASGRPFEGVTIVRVARGARPPEPPPSDGEHVYLVDPHGNVMMRWPAAPDRKRMLKDLERLLRASQIG